MTGMQGNEEVADLDVLVVGAGISGIDVAYRLQERCPDLTYVVVEARESIGGTWDLFRYPGVRSDSDFFTLAYPFHPWRGDDAIVSGEQIRDYLHEVVAEHGIDRHIRFGQRVTAAAWDSAAGRWEVSLQTADGVRTLSPRFLVLGTGYYDYDQPYDPGFAGVEDYAGRLVHPQFWPEDLDCRDMRVAVIGSGATAVTVVPALTRAGADVTMVQRTPTYVVAQPRRDSLADLVRRVLPPTPAHHVIRAKNALIQVGLYGACRVAPGPMRGLILAQARKAIGDRATVDTHFSPPYDPWDQRLCIATEGDLFAAVREGSARVVTGSIDRFVPEGLRMTDGTLVEADVVVTATGLSLSLLGGAEFTVDGDRVDPASSHVYQGAMLSGLPNLAFVVGYINQSWTMRADLTARFVTRVLRRLVDEGRDRVVPVFPGGQGPSRPVMNLSAGYLRRSADEMPRATSRYPWAMSQNVLRDGWAVHRADLDHGLEWTGRRHDSERGPAGEDEQTAGRTAKVS